MKPSPRSAPKKAPAPKTAAAPKERVPVPRRGEGSKRVYEGLRSSILSLELVPGAVIDDARIAQQYGVSRTPIREAFVRLESEGLIVLLPNRGARVAPLDLARIKDYLEGIDLIQRAVTKWATVRRTPNQLALIGEQAARFEAAVASRDSDRMVMTNHDFHLAIAEACGNALIADSYHRLLAEGLRIARFTLNPRYYSSGRQFEDFLKSVVEEHRGMLQAFETQDVDLAERMARAHTAHTQERFVWFLRDTLSPLISVDFAA